MMFRNLDATGKQMEFWNVRMKELTRLYPDFKRPDIIKGLEKELTNSFSAFMVRRYGANPSVADLTRDQRQVHSSILTLASRTINKVADMREASLCPLSFSLR
jgi:hypothetical protein